MSSDELEIKRFAEEFANLVKFVPANKNELGEWYGRAERLQREKLFGHVPHFVRHYVSDADIRMKDEAYAEMQDARIKNFLSFLKNGVMPTDDDLDVEV
jgi:hypothetical protein